eukprot:scaffold268_cov140-Skeletonema_menzelii.AAC.14
MDQEEAPLPASEYPCCIDSLNSLPLHEQSGGGVDGSAAASHQQQQHHDPEIVASTLRQNSIHRWSLSTRTIAHYCRLEQIGEGTYGQVYRAQCLDRTLAHPAGGEIVALKKIRLHHPGYWGIPPTVLREIKILKQLQHKNLVKMFEVVSSKGVEELDWEDEREDEKRKKAKESKASSSSKNDKSNNSTPVLNSEDSNTNKNDNTTSSAITNTKPAKKKKDPMSDLDKLRLLDMAFKFSEVQVKSIARQLLQVLEFMHERNFVHRDLKTSNILITDNFELKLADFGLARCLESSFMGRLFEGDGYSAGEGEFTNKVITLWYRPPELLLGETRYGCAVDIWSAGCIFAEIILGRPIFTGKAEMDQLKLIFDLIGTPTERSWEGFRELKLIRTGEFSIDKQRKPRLRDKYGEKIKPAAALGLLEKLLELDPKKRFTASRALNHRYFQASPIAPDDPKELGKIDLGGDGSGYHEFKTKKRRREAKAVAKMAEDEAKRQGLTVEKQKEAFDVAYREHLQKGASADKKEEKKEKQQQQQQQQLEVEKSKREKDQKGKSDKQPPSERDQLPNRDDFPPPSRHPPRNMHPLMNHPPPNGSNHPRDCNRDVPHSRDLNRDMPPPRGDMRGSVPPRDIPPPRGDMMGRGPRDMPHPGDIGRGPPGPRDMPHPPRDMGRGPLGDMGRGPGPRDMPHPRDMGRGPRDMPHPFDIGRGGPRDMGRGHPMSNDRMDQGGPWNMNMGSGDGRRMPDRMGNNWGPAPSHLRDQRGPPPPDQQFRHDHYGPSNDQYAPRRPNGGDYYDPMNVGRNGGVPPNDHPRRGPPDSNFDRGRGPPDDSFYDDRGRGPPNRNHHDQHQSSQDEEFRSRRQHDDDNDRRKERSKDRSRDSLDKGRKQKESNESRSARDDNRDPDRPKGNKDERDSERRRSRSSNRSERKRSRERGRDSSRDKDKKKEHRRSHRDDDDRRHRQENDKKSERGGDDQSRRERKRSKDSDRDGGRKRQKRSRHDKDSSRRDSSRIDDRTKERSERDERRGDGRGGDRDRFTPPPGRQYDQYGNPVVADRDRAGQRNRDQRDESRDGRYGPSSQDWRPRDGHPGDGPNWRPPMGRDGHPDDRRRHDDRRR